MSLGPVLASLWDLTISVFLWQILQVFLSQKHLQKLSFPGLNLTKFVLMFWKKSLKFRYLKIIFLVYPKKQKKNWLLYIYLRVYYKKKLVKTNASVEATRHQCGSFLMKPCQTLFCFTNDFFFKRFGRELTENAKARLQSWFRSVVPSMNAYTTLPTLPYSLAYFEG